MWMFLSDYIINLYILKRSFSGEEIFISSAMEWGRHTFIDLILSLVCLVMGFGCLDSFDFSILTDGCC